jgi:hypothetical protein
MRAKSMASFTYTSSMALLEEEKTQIFIWIQVKSIMAKV